VSAEQTTISPALTGSDEPRQRGAKATEGKALPPLLDEIDCEDCGGDGECFECSGTGHCSTCDGEGKVESAKAYCNALYWEDGVTQQRCDRRAPEGAGKAWRCEEHRRQQAWARDREHVGEGAV
jgi:hypothetical protein